MTYFGFLAIFLGIPILLLALWHTRTRSNPALPAAWRLQKTSILVIALHVVIALLYTTPWDNYLVATGVWWYDPALVNGLTLGWVPIEEYTFFVVQPIFSSLLLLAIMQRWQPAVSAIDRPQARLISVAGVSLIWLISVIVLLSGWQPGVYLGLELGWALPPIILQLAFGADILWHYGKKVALAVLAPTIFLSAADALAISTGIWTINPEQSLHWLIAGILPFEEFIFFLLTNTLIVFGVTLSLAPSSRERFQSVKEWLASRLPAAKRKLQRSAEF